MRSFDLLNGCVVASLAHALAMSKYPDFSYEQSWDGYNYSFKQLFGLSGSFSFAKNRCCGAVRINGNYDKMKKQYVSSYPAEINWLINNECLQYLLEQQENGVTPLYSSTFWIDGEHVISFDDADGLTSVLSLFLGDHEAIFDTWVRYYSLNSREVIFLRRLTSQKMRAGFSDLFIKKAAVAKKQIFVNEQMRISLEEMRIYII